MISEWAAENADRLNTLALVVGAAFVVALFAKGAFWALGAAAGWLNARHRAKAMEAKEAAYAAARERAVRSRITFD
ncbi:hypothetical protein [Agromyces subbeticus]|uniref:hypothetical protein n=1 Tax=Agromyces subbeticus TaxID=293890 RepID=UPI0003B34AFE|nr:hypothetical protein [Agromyces subbeticus]